MATAKSINSFQTSIVHSLSLVGYYHNYLLLLSLQGAPHQTEEGMSRNCPNWSSRGGGGGGGDNGKP